MNTRRIDDPVLYMETSRAKNRVRSLRQRAKLQRQNKSSLTVWINSELRTALNTLATERGSTIGDTVESLLRDGLNLATREPFDEAADRIGAALTTAAAEVEDLHAAVVESGDRFRRGVTEVIQRQRDEAAAAGMLLPELTPVLLENTEEESTSAEPTSKASDEPSTRVVPTDTDALMREVAGLLDSGISGSDIVQRLNASGRRTTSGKLFTPGNLLSVFRRWQAKQPPTV